MTGRGVREEEPLLFIIKKLVEKQVVLMVFNRTVETFHQNTRFSSPSPPFPTNIFPLLPFAHAGDVSAGRASFVGRVKDTMVALRWPKVGVKNLDASPPNPINRKSMESKLKRPRAVELARTCNRNQEYQSQDKGVDSVCLVGSPEESGDY